MVLGIWIHTLDIFLSNIRIFKNCFQFHLNRPKSSQEFQKKWAISLFHRHLFSVLNTFQLWSHPTPSLSSLTIKEIRVLPKKGKLWIAYYYMLRPTKLASSKATNLLLTMHLNSQKPGISLRTSHIWKSFSNFF